MLTKGLSFMSLPVVLLCLAGHMSSWAMDSNEANYPRRKLNGGVNKTSSLKPYHDYQSKFSINATDNIGKSRCQECPRSYSRFSDLRAHFNLEHPDKLDLYPNMLSFGRYRCQSCNQSYSRKKTLDSHRKKCALRMIMDNNSMDSNSSANDNSLNKNSIDFLLGVKSNDCTTASHPHDEQ